MSTEEHPNGLHNRWAIVRRIRFRISILFSVTRVMERMTRHNEGVSVQKTATFFGLFFFKNVFLFMF